MWLRAIALSPGQASKFWIQCALYQIMTIFNSILIMKAMLFKHSKLQIPYKYSISKECAVNQLF